MLDFHLHLWNHSPGTPPPTFEQLERYCERAAGVGIEQIAITEHCYRFTRIADEVLPHWNRPTTGDVAAATDHVLEAEGGADLDVYVEVLRDAQDRGLPLLIGLEVDHFSGATDAMSQVLNDYPFDVLLGSVHWLAEWLFDAYGNEVFLQRWLDRDCDDVYSEYVDAIIELAQSGAIDVLAHIDVIKVAGFTASRLVEHETRLVEGLAGSNVAIEFSTAGLHKPVASTYPSLDLLDRLLAAGFGLTTASDGHSLEAIGRDYDALVVELDRRGIDQLVTFDRRSPRLVPR